MENITSVPNEEFRHMLNLRGVKSPCTICQGTGVRLYGSTSTWRGGMGGASMTYGVCDACWGTGDKRRKGEDLRELYKTINAIKTQAKTLKKALEKANEHIDWLGTPQGYSYSDFADVHKIIDDALVLR